MTSLARRLLAVLVLSSGALRAADYEWLMATKGEWDQRADWRVTANWKPAGPPATAADRGIVAAGKTLNAGGDLGSDSARPTIVLQPGGRMYLTDSIRTPIELAGGLIDMNWRGINVAGPVKVTADSVIRAQGDGGDGASKVLSGRLTNPGPITVHTEGNQRWMQRCGAGFTGTVAIDRGTLFVFDSVSTDALGSGPVRIRAGARLGYREPYAGGDLSWTIANDLSGGGAVQTGGPDKDLERKRVVLQGITLHPGDDGKPATLAIHSSVRMATAGRAEAAKYTRVVIDVTGTGDVAGIDYGQLYIGGRLENSLDSADLVLNVSPSLSPAQLKGNHLKVLTVATGDFGSKGFRPFHAVTVVCGKKTGKVTVTYCPAEERSGGWVEVSDIELPPGEAP